ncbi:MAG: hypothetical protein ACFBQW_01470 [Sphingomonadaceae bacterium]
MSAIARRGEELAERRALARARQIAEAAATELPRDIEVRREGRKILIEGRALGARMMADEWLRGLGLAARSLGDGRG